MQLIKFLTNILFDELIYCGMDIQLQKLKDSDINPNTAKRT